MFSLISNVWRNENKFIPAVSILSLNSTRFLSGSAAIISGSVTLIFDPPQADCDSLYSHHSATGRTLDASHVAKILLTKKAQGRARTQSENDVHCTNTFTNSPILFQKRTSSVEIGKKFKDGLLRVENGVVDHEVWQWRHIRRVRNCSDQCFHLHLNIIWQWRRQSCSTFSWARQS